MYETNLMKVAKVQRPELRYTSKPSAQLSNSYTVQVQNRPKPTYKN